MGQRIDSHPIEKSKSNKWSGGEGSNTWEGKGVGGHELNKIIKNNKRGIRRKREKGKYNNGRA